MVFAVTLTEGGRQTIGIVLIILHLISLGGGCGICGAGVFLLSSLRSKVNLIEGYDGDVLPIVLMVVGSLAAFVNLVGVKVAFDVGSPSRRKRLRLLILIQVILLLLVKFALFTAAMTCFAHRRHLTKSFHHGLIKAMEKYQEDANMKHHIDLLQMQNQCCGNAGYEDWFEIQWISNNFIDLQNTDVQSKMTSGQYLIDDVPFSCCRPTAPRPCIHHHVHDNDVHFSYDYQTDLTLHQMGCKEKLMEFFGARLNKFGGGALLLFGLQTLTALLVRYLQTSISTAIDGGDPEMPSSGFLCPTRGDAANPTSDMKSLDDGGFGRGGGVGGGLVGGGPPLGRPPGGDRGKPSGSLEDFEAHDLGFQDDADDTFFDDSTFDDDFDDDTYLEPIKPTKGRNQYVDDEPVYATIPDPIQNENIYDAVYESEPVYENISKYAKVAQQPALQEAMSLSRQAAANQSLAPPKRPAGPPQQPPTGKPPAKGKMGSKPARPSEPPSSSSKKGQKPKRPDKPPSRQAAQKAQPKTSTPKKSQPMKSSAKQSSPKKSSGKTKSSTSPKGKKSPQKVKKAGSSAGKSAKKPNKKLVKSTSPKRSPRSSKPKKGKTKGAKKSSPKRSSKKKSGKKRSKSKNRNNNILDDSKMNLSRIESDSSSDEESIESSEELSGSSEEVYDISSDTSSSLETLDLESGSSSSSEESDASSDTPLLR